MSLFEKINQVEKLIGTNLDRIIGIFDPEKAHRRSTYRNARQFEGAAKSRRTANWKASSTSANTENAAALEILRNRARDLVRNNPYANRAIDIIATNTIGNGIVGNISDENSEIALFAQELWNDWANSTACDFDCKQNLAGLQKTIMRAVAESGEVIVRLRRTEDSFPLKLQILESDHIATNRIFRNAENENRIVNGIELDDNGCPVAYHLFVNHPGNIGNDMVDVSKTLEVVRVPSSDIMHVYRESRPGQLRGVSWLAPVMIRLKELDEFEDAQLVKQKVSACFSAFIHDIEVPDQQNNNDEFDLEHLEPGIVEYLPPGKDIKFASPPLPNSDSYKFYMSYHLHGIAAGIGVSYEGLTGDFSEVNFSSARMGDLQFRRNIADWQSNIIITKFLNKTFDAFKATAILLNQPFENVSSSWVVPKRDMIDPTKEVPAKIKEIRAGLTTLSDAIRQNGKDPAKHYAEIANDNEIMDNLKLTLDSDPRKTASSGALQADNSEPENIDDETVRQLRG
jgi:lambda family phage portal protein